MKYSYNEALKLATEFFGNELSASVFISKYAMQDNDGMYDEATPDQLHDRLAKEFARIDSEKYGLEYKERYDVYFDAMKNFARVVPQGSPMAAVGNKYQTMSASNCVVVESPKDSMGGIMDTAKHLTQLMKRRCGVGVDISTLRPEGFKVNNAAKTTSGAWSFADLYSYVTRMTAQNNRRGACMITLSSDHPDVSKFATSKHDITKVTGANISVRLSDKFLTAVANNTEYEQRFPLEGEPIFTNKVKAKEVWAVIVNSATQTADPGLIFWDNMINNLPAHCYEEFKTISTNPCCFAEDSTVLVNTKEGLKEIKDITSNDLIWVDSEKTWAKTSGYFSAGTYDVYNVSFSNNESLEITLNHKLEKYGCGLIELKDLNVGDKISVESISPAKNIPYTVINSIELIGKKPVGCIEVDKYHKFTANGIISGNSEIALSAYDSCRLVSLNLTGYVKNAFDKDSNFDMALFQKDIRTAMQMIDNLVDIELELIKKIQASCIETDEIELWQKLYDAGYKGRRTGLGTHGLADTLAMLNIKYDSDDGIKMIEKIYSFFKEIAYDQSIELAKVRGSFPLYDFEKERKCDFINRLPRELLEKMQAYGRRNISILTQAPTGSVSIVSKCGEFNSYNVSSGVEPVFRNSYTRRKKINIVNGNVKVDHVDAVGDKWQEYKVFHSNVQNYLNKFNLPEDTELPDYFVTSDQVSWNKRVQIQSVEQLHVDHSISSCLAEGNHLVHTSSGLRYIEDLVTDKVNEKTFSPVTSTVKTINHENKEVNIDESFFNGKAECLKISLPGYREIIGTKNHRIITLDENHNMVWKRLDEIKEKDVVVLRTGLECFGDSNKKISTVLGKFVPTASTFGSAKEIIIPERMTKELARLLGYLISDGSVCENGISLSQQNNNVVEDFQNLVKSIFGLESNIVEDHRAENLVSVVVNSRILRDYMRYLGVKTGSHNKTVPTAIFSCAGKYQTAEFIKGLTLDGFVSESKIGVMTTTSFKLAKEIQVLLDQYNIFSGICDGSDDGERIFPNGKLYKTRKSWIVYCGKNEAVKFNEFIGFAENRKIEECKIKLKRPSRIVSDTFIPDNGLRKKFRKEVLPNIKSNKMYDVFHSLSSGSKQDMDIYRDNLKSMVDVGFKVSDHLLDETYRFVKVISISDAGIHNTFDISVKDGNSYIVNSMISHNTINLPRGTTPETVGAIYLEAWKQGLKGITVYVEGSKDGVLISDEEKKKQESKKSGRPESIEYASAPKRGNILPCDIHQATIKGKKWVVLVGMLGNDPYELFCGFSENLSLPSKCNKGKVVKKGKGEYDLHVDVGGEDLIIKNIIKTFDNPEFAWTTRLVSVSLRHGVAIDFLVEQLSKDGGLSDINRVMSRILKKYIKDGQKVKTNTKCEGCKGTNLVYSEGCVKCMDCGFSKCN